MAHWSHATNWLPDSISGTSEGYSGTALSIRERDPQSKINKLPYFDFQELDYNW